MTAFEKLVNLIGSCTDGAYMAAEMTDGGYTEHQFRPGAGAHNVYSLSKSVTGCAVGILEAEGRLRDTDTVFTYLSAYFPAGYDERWQQVTLKDVMLHRTGVDSGANIDIDVMDFWADGRTDFLKHVLSQPIVSEPGKGPFVYCDTNYYLIGRVVEEVTGMTCGAFLQKRLFDPLKWRGNAWGTCPDNHTLCGTGLFATSARTAICWRAAAITAKNSCLRPNGSAKPAAKKARTVTVSQTPATGAGSLPAACTVRACIYSRNGARASAYWGTICP